MKGRNQATTADLVSIIPVPRLARAAGDQATLPTIWWSEEPARRRGQGRRLQQRDLKTALVAACEQIRDLETKLAVLERFAVAKIS